MKKRRRRERLPWLPLPADGPHVLGPLPHALVVQVLSHLPRPRDFLSVSLASRGMYKASREAHHHVTARARVAGDVERVARAFPNLATLGVSMRFAPIGHVEATRSPVGVAGSSPAAAGRSDGAESARKGRQPKKRKCGSEEFGEDAGGHDGGDGDEASGEGAGAVPSRKKRRRDSDAGATVVGAPRASPGGGSDATLEIKAQRRPTVCGSEIAHDDDSNGVVPPRVADLCSAVGLLWRSLECLDLTGCMLNAASIAAVLTSASACTRLRRIILAGNDLGPGALNAVALWLGTGDRPLKVLEVHDNPRILESRAGDALRRFKSTWSRGRVVTRAPVQSLRSDPELHLFAIPKPYPAGMPWPVRVDTAVAPESTPRRRALHL